MATGWGLSQWGIDHWGNPTSLFIPGGGAPPFIIQDAQRICEVEGGTIITILGSSFFPEFVPMVFSGPTGGPYTLVAEGYLFDPDYDLTTTQAIVGMPALPSGVYALAVRTPSGQSNIVDNALAYKPFADEEIAQKGRSSWSGKWHVGIRLGA